MKTKPKRDPELDNLVENIGKIIRSTSKRMDEILKDFPDIPNPLKKQKNLVSKPGSGVKRKRKKK